jgi:uncharacterized protein (DUF2384 family)
MRKSKGGAVRAKGAVRAGRINIRGTSPQLVTLSEKEVAAIAKAHPRIKGGKSSHFVLTAKEVVAAGKALQRIERGGSSVVVRATQSSETFGAETLTQFFDNRGLVVIDDVADWFGMSKTQLADTVGVKAETLHRAQRATAAKTQSRVKEMLEIIGRVAEWAGGKDQAMAWYRAEPIPAFGGRTAEALVKEGKATAVRDYLDHVAVGGFA